MYQHLHPKKASQDASVTETQSLDNDYKSIID
uniref:Uncharacterized protein n=1 Tax=Siphoviridae sp. ctwDi18 TaxID=2827970 RepID=A0A8S5T9G3_9CAUD|nr:MAG TPA: hypothetical protein [Siphoviridae sp. ctwDi18]